RMEKKFNVAIRNAETPTSSLWALDVDARQVKRLTRDTTITVQNFVISPDGKYVGFRGTSSNRYKRNITEQNINTDLFLLDATSGAIERLTDNAEIAESELSFSPDMQWIAFSSSDDM